MFLGFTAGSSSKSSFLSMIRKFLTPFFLPLSRRSFRTLIWGDERSGEERQENVSKHTSKHNHTILVRNHVAMPSPPCHLTPKPDSRSSGNQTSTPCRAAQTFGSPASSISREGNPACRHNQHGQSPNFLSSHQRKHRRQIQGGGRKACTWTAPSRSHYRCSLCTGAGGQQISRCR